jgi:hypothetical protein
MVAPASRPAADLADTALANAYELIIEVRRRGSARAGLPIAKPADPVAGPTQPTDAERPADEAARGT